MKPLPAPTMIPAPQEVVETPLTIELKPDGTRLFSFTPVADGRWYGLAEIDEERRVIRWRVLT